VSIDDSDRVDCRERTQPDGGAVHHPEHDLLDRVSAVIAAIAGGRPFARCDQFSELTHRGDGLRRKKTGKTAWRG